MSSGRREWATLLAENRLRIRFVQFNTADGSAVTALELPAVPAETTPAALLITVVPLLRLSGAFAPVATAAVAAAGPMKRKR